MGSRAKWLFCALVCLAAFLTAATLAQAVEQTPKNGCTSPVTYDGSITSPPGFVPAGSSPNITFRGWFEIESVAPSADPMTVEYLLPNDPNPHLILELTSLAIQQNGENSNPTGSDIPYSNQGTSVRPDWQDFVVPIPVEAQEVTGVRFRIHFATADALYQGFRGLGVDNIAIPNFTTESFEVGSESWTLDGPPGAGAPGWQVLSNPTSISIRSPEINPNLVTLASGDPGTLPAADATPRYAWFGDQASGTFCGPDFASIDQAPDTIITDGPSGSTAEEDATFSFTATEQAFFLCSLDGGPPEVCESPKQYTGLSNGPHTFSVQATDFTGNPDPTPATRTWTVRDATLADLPAPEQGVSVNVDEVSGTVRVGIRAAAAAGASGGASQKGIQFVPLNEAEQIPVGSFLDTTKGTVRLQSAANKSGKRQSGKFLDGLFQVRQSKKRKARGLTDLVLKGSSFRRCRRASRGKTAGASLSRRQIRRLRANARGRFRTSGSNSSATVRGTIWDITDRCDGTLTHVKRGKVVVRDFRRRKNITLTSGKSYLAKARF